MDVGMYVLHIHACMDGWMDEHYEYIYACGPGAGNIDLPSIIWQAQDDSNTSSNRNGVSGEFYNQPARSYANGNNVTLSTRGGGSSRFDADGGEKR